VAYQRNRGGTQTAPQNGSGGGGKNPPCFKRRIWSPSGTCELAVFEKQGDKHTNFFIKLTRSYPNPEKQGEYVETSILLNPQELLIAADLLKIGYDFCLEELNRE